MKIRLVILLFLILTSSFVSDQCPKGTKFVDKKYYTVCYSEKYRNPLKATYSLYKPVHVVDRTGMSFYNEPGLITSLNKDYEGNQYDQGHLVPFEDFSSSEEKAKSTFSRANCAVQHYQLNRGAWKLLETQVRNWSKKDSLVIVIDVIIDKNSGKLPSGTYIPSFFQKTITWVKSKKKRKFKFPNEQCDKNIYLYEVK